MISLATENETPNKRKRSDHWSIHSFADTYPCDTGWNHTSSTFYKLDSENCLQYLENNYETNKIWFIIMQTVFVLVMFMMLKLRSKRMKEEN